MIESVRDAVRVTVELRATDPDVSHSFAIEVAGEEISPTLAVTPLVQDSGSGPAVIPGWWRVTHRPTGRALSAPCCRECARAVAAALAGLPIPWGQLTAIGASAQLGKLPGDARRAARLIVTAAIRCNHGEEATNDEVD